MSKTYEVSYLTEVEADSPQEAADLFVNDLRGGDPVNVVVVTPKGKMKEFTID